MVMNAWAAATRRLKPEAAPAPLPKHQIVQEEMRGWGPHEHLASPLVLSGVLYLVYVEVLWYSLWFQSPSGDSHREPV